MRPLSLYCSSCDFSSFTIFGCLKQIVIHAVVSSFMKLPTELIIPNEEVLTHMLSHLIFGAQLPQLADEARK